jgi:hypothetical protein
MRAGQEEVVTGSRASPSCSPILLCRSITIRWNSCGSSSVSADLSNSGLKYHCQFRVWPQRRRPWAANPSSRAMTGRIASPGRRAGDAAHLEILIVVKEK